MSLRKKCPNTKLFLVRLSSCIQTECGDLLRKSPDTFFGHFLHSVYFPGLAFNEFNLNQFNMPFVSKIRLALKLILE